MTDQQQRPPSSGQRPTVEPSQMTNVDDGPTVETPVAARAGFLGKPVALVLAVSLILAIGAGLFVGFFAR